LDDLSNDIVKYYAEDHIFSMSLTGYTDDQKLDQIVQLLKSSLDSHLEQDSALKLLIDFRDTIWNSEKTHLSTRQVLGKHLQKFREHCHFFALLTNENSSQTSEHEAHFTDERQALTWLQSKK
jgi:hypothetical protein